MPPLVNVQHVCLLGLLTFVVAAVAPQATGQWSQDFWIATWATASVGRPQHPRVPPAGAWPHFTDQTLRQVVRTSMGGSSARVVFSNAFGTTPVTIGAAALAVRDHDAAIKPGTARMLTFGGAPTAVVAPGAVLVSDTTDLVTPSLGDIIIDLYLPGTTDVASPLTMHPDALQTGYVASGNRAGAPDIEAVQTTRSWFLLGRLEVTGTPGSATVAVLGDSITDGTGSRSDANRRWTDRLAERLTSWNSRLGVANLGIAGNGLLGDGIYAFGLNMQARFDRDVLALPSVQHLIVLAGINDIGLARSGEMPSVEALRSGFQQLIARARARGIRVYGGTLPPFEGSDAFTQEGEAARLALNQWIRSSGAFDGVVDFDAVLRDPAAPSRLRADFDSGDHLHPGEAGYVAMGNAIPLEMFGPPSNRR